MLYVLPFFRPTSPVISPMSPESIGAAWKSLSPGMATTGAWPVANLAIFFPFEILVPTPVVKAEWVNGATLTANVDVGIYDENWNLLVSKGSTAQTGASAVQIVDTTDIVLDVGRYYGGMALDNNVGIVWHWNAIAQVAAGVGCAQMAAAFPLPVTVTPALFTQTYMPLLVFLTGTVG